MTPAEEAAQILTRILEALARQNGRALAAGTRSEIARACELLSSRDDLEELLDDLPAPPRRSPGEYAVADPGFQQWRARRYEEG